MIFETRAGRSQGVGDTLEAPGNSGKKETYS
jgi:hypothetical protein